MESFPPFVNAQGDGLTIDMLHAIEDISDIEFTIEIMTYARAKYQLKTHHINIIGHTPKNLETADFYQYAQELDWIIDTTSDIFVFDQNLKKNSSNFGKISLIQNNFRNNVFC